MKSVALVSRILAVTAVSLAFCLSSCGGGGTGGGTIPIGVDATFTPLSPTVPPQSVTMQAGGTSGSTFTIQILAKDVTNFFSTNFHVIFNPTSAVFDSMDASGSFLHTNQQRCSITTTLTCSGNPDCPTGETCNDSDISIYGASLVRPGDLAVFATRVQDQVGTISGFSGTGTVLVLTFHATRPVPGPGNTFSFGPPRQVCSPDSAPGCTPITVAWSGGTLTTH